MAANRSRRARAARRRKRRMDRADNDLTEAQWEALKSAWGACAYCAATKQALQRDCVLPLSRGGRYTLDNVVPACPSCNASKCNYEVTGWMRRRRFDERSFLVRHLEIRTALAVRAPTAEGSTSESDDHREGSGACGDQHAGTVPDL
jgi:5-methylcytosine-specific restriction endonuclease McrA